MHFLNSCGVQSNDRLFRLGRAEKTRRSGGVLRIPRDTKMDLNVLEFQ